MTVIIAWPAIKLFSLSPYSFGWTCRNQSTSRWIRKDRHHTSLPGKWNSTLPHPRFLTRISPGSSSSHILAPRTISLGGGGGEWRGDHPQTHSPGLVLWLYWHSAFHPLELYNFTLYRYQCRPVITAASSQLLWDSSSDRRFNHKLWLYRMIGSQLQYK